MLTDAAQGQFGFRKILPKRRSPLAGPASPLSTAQLLELVAQVDAFAQLLMQACLFMPQRARQLEPLNLVHKLVLEKKRLLFLNGVRGYEVYLVDLKFGNSSLKTLRAFLSAHFDLAAWRPCDAERLRARSLENLLTFEFAPQISVLQCPALEAQNLLEEAVRKGLPRDRKLALLAELVPLLRREYIPLLGEETAAGANKFSAVEDALLLNGLRRHSCKQLQAVQAQFLPHKSLEEVRNRYKNLTRQKAPLNTVKAWKLRETQPLCPAELRNLEKGQLWFGPHNARLIARYFLPARSEQCVARQLDLLQKRAEPPGEAPAPVEAAEEAEEAAAIELAGLSYAADFCAEPPETARENEAFLEFLKSVVSDRSSIAELLARPAQPCHTVSLNLSEGKLSVRSFSKRARRLFEIKRDSLSSTNLRVVDDQLFLSRDQVTSADIKHTFVDEKAFEAKRPRTALCAEPGVMRLVPTFKELQTAAANVLERKGYSLRGNFLFDKIII